MAVPYYVSGVCERGGERGREGNRGGGGDIEGKGDREREGARARARSAPLPSARTPRIQPTWVPHLLMGEIPPYTKPSAS